MQAKDAIKINIELGQFISLGYLQDMTDQELLHGRLLGPRQPANRRGDDRAQSPTVHDLPLLGDKRLEGPLANHAPDSLPAQERECHAVRAWTRQFALELLVSPAA